MRLLFRTPVKARHGFPDFGLNGSCWWLCVVLWLMGCSGDSGAGVRPDSPGLSAKEREIVVAARRAVAQFDDWADRAEFKLERRGNVWHVTAWRVVHPEAKGSKRYVPWGYRQLVIDDAGKVLEYTKGNDAGKIK